MKTKQKQTNQNKVKWLVTEKKYLLDSLIYIVTCVTWKSIMKISDEKVSVTFI